MIHKCKGNQRSFKALKEALAKISDTTLNWFSLCFELWRIGCNMCGPFFTDRVSIDYTKNSDDHVFRGINKNPSQLDSTQFMLKLF